MNYQACDFCGKLIARDFQDATAMGGIGRDIYSHCNECADEHRKFLADMKVRKAPDSDTVTFSFTETVE